LLLGNGRYYRTTRKKHQRNGDFCAIGAEINRRILNWGINKEGVRVWSALNWPRIESIQVVVDTVMKIGFLKVGEILDTLDDYQFSTKTCTQRMESAWAVLIAISQYARVDKLIEIQHMTSRPQSRIADHTPPDDDLFVMT
jgi:hypothetical protein